MTFFDSMFAKSYLWYSERESEFQAYISSAMLVALFQFLNVLGIILLVSKFVFTQQAGLDKLTIIAISLPILIFNLLRYSGQRKRIVKSTAEIGLGKVEMLYMVVSILALVLLYMTGITKR